MVQLLILSLPKSWGCRTVKRKFLPCVKHVRSQSIGKRWSYISYRKTTGVTRYRVPATFFSFFVCKWESGKECSELTVSWRPSIILLWRRSAFIFLLRARLRVLFGWDCKAFTNTQADNACKFKVGQPRSRQYILSSAISSGINRFDLIASGQTALKQLESLTRKPANYTSNEAGSSRLRTELVDFTSGVKVQMFDQCRISLKELEVLAPKQNHRSRWISFFKIMLFK